MTKLRMHLLLLAWVATLAWLLVFPVQHLFGQKSRLVARPNLAGSWILDKSKSSKDVVADLTVTITHNDPEIRMTRRAAANGEQRVDELLYYSDGRGETNHLVETKTTWDGQRLVIKSSTDIFREKGIDFTRTEKWQLTKDDLLLWTTSMTVNGSSNPGNVPGLSGPRIDDIKRVFRRSSP